MTSFLTWVTHAECHRQVCVCLGLCVFMCLRLHSAESLRDKALEVLPRDDIISLGWCLPCLSQDRDALLLHNIPRDWTQHRFWHCTSSLCPCIRKKMNENKITVFYGRRFLGCLEKPTTDYIGRDCGLFLRQLLNTSSRTAYGPVEVWGYMCLYNKSAHTYAQCVAPGKWAKHAVTGHWNKQSLGAWQRMGRRMRQVSLLLITRAPHTSQQLDV